MNAGRMSAVAMILVGGALGLGCDVAPEAEGEPAPVAPQARALYNGGVIGPGTGGVFTVEDPDDPNQKPRKPTTPVVASRTASQLTMSFVDRSSYEAGFAVYSAPDSSGPWTQIATLPASPGLDVTISFTHSGLGRDTIHWYQVAAFNYLGESRSVPGGGTTLDGRGGIGRVQLRLHTSSVSDANTDDKVHVALNYAQESNGTFLDYGRNDFERGDDFTYDLVADDLTDLSQITELYIWKTGSDGWCFDDMTLLVNGKPVFEEHNAPCRWLDDEGGHVKYHMVSRAQLRAHPLWQAYQTTIPRPTLPRLELASRIEGFVGSMIHRANDSEGLSWAGSARDLGFWVAVTRKDETAVHVRFTLGANRSSLIPGNELESTISFDLRFTGVCRTATTPPQVLMQSENAQASIDISTLSHIETLGLINFWREDFRQQILDGLPTIERMLSLDNTIACAMPQVAEDGTVDFSLSFRQTGGTYWRPIGRLPSATLY